MPAHEEYLNSRASGVDEPMWDAEQCTCDQFDDWLKIGTCPYCRKFDEDAEDRLSREWPEAI